MSEHEPPPASADAAAAPHDTPAGAQHEAPAVPAAAAAAEPAAPSVAAAEAAHATPPPAATPATLPTESAPHHPAASSVEEMAPSTVPALPAQLDGADDADAKAAPPLVTPTTARVAVAVKDEADDMDDDGTAAASSYGTRSRNRAGPRPNYADETDDAFEAGLIMDEGAAAAAAAASTAAAAPAVSKQSSAEAPSRAARLEQPPQSMPTAAGATASPSAAQAAGNAPADPPRQKRKYVWKNGSRPNRNAEASTSEAPAKRRKTEDAPATVASTAPVKASAKTIVRDSSVFSFEKTGAMLQDGKLIADDGTEFCVDDNVYLVCEPPSEPYYLARIMEFRKDDMNDANAPITHMLVNWWFRPKDIGRFSIDARQLFASMQSDESPLMSLRGKLVVKHRNQISDFDEFRRQRDSFWFMQLYDRYIQRVYDMVPAEAVFNVPPNVKKAIDERWKFLVVEPVRAKELTSAVKLCKRCNGYSAPNDSVDCGVCKNTYHMDCVRPPLLKKPSRGFAWSCGPCSRAREKKLEARHNTTLSDGEDEDAHEEEDDAANADSSAASVVDTAMFDVDESTEVNKANMWPWRYLGIHCSVEDILQHDDRAVYPRASTRLGLRHQAAVGAWPGRPIELVKPPEARKRHYKTTAKKESKLFNLKAWKEAKMAKEAAASSAAEAEKSGRPKWIQDEPVGYVARGEDYDNGDPRCTAERLFVAPATDAKPSFAAANVKTNSHERICDDYMAQLKGIARQRGFTRHVFPLARSDGSKPEPQIVLPTNYIDKALQALCKHNFNLSAALAEMHNVRSPRDFKDPVLSQDDLRKFEDGVAKYGSELRLVRKHVSKTRSHGEIVRFYYNWKKTERGQVIWGRHDARKGSRRKTEASWTEIADDEDDSAFDNGKAVARKRKFVCKFCSTTTSRRWRRAPVAPGAVALVDPKGSAKDKANQQVVALCQRCAIPWRRYGIRWEDPEEYAKSVNATSGRALKRINDELMLRELVLANEEARVPTTGIVASAAALVGITVTVTSEAASGKKKQEVVVESKKKAAPAPPPRPPTPPIVPGEPKMRAFPCAVCAGGEDVEPLIACAVCRLTVHRRCFAVPEHVKDFKWTCDTCVNDKTAAVSFVSFCLTLLTQNYNCVLCTVHDRQQVMVEAPKSNSRKKTDRDRERERQEKVLADKMAADYKRDQLAKGRPLWPREAVKPTASNNWVHVTCAVWTPEVRFADARKLEGAEGIGSLASIPARLDAVCKLCKTQDGACVGCNVDKCAATFHVGCAREAGYRLGFDIRPVKSTQKSNTTTIALGNENGLMSAVVYCPDHDPAATPILHSPVELHAESGRTALQAFVESYKQADKTLTGTARKANMLSQSAKTAAVATSRDVKKAVPVWTAPAPADDVPILDRIYLPEAHEDKRNVCLSCGNDTSFRWWLAEFRAIYQAESEGRPIRRSDGIPDEVQCHRCHVLETKGIIPTPPPSDGDEDVPPPPKDFFELASRAAAGKAANGAWDGLAAQQDYDLRLGKLRITIVAPNGDRLAFHGQELRVFDPPLHIWNHVVGTLVDKLRYDVGRQVVISQMGQAIRSGEDLLAVVSHMMRDGVYLVTWRIVDGGPGHGSAGPDRLQHAGSPPPPPVMPPRLSPSPITFGPLQGQGTAPAPPQAHRDGPGPGPGPGSARSPIHMHASQARHLSPLLPGPPPPHHGPPQGMSPPPGMMHAPPPPGPPQGPPQGLMHHGPPGPPPPHMYGPPSSLHHRGPPPGPPMHHPSYGPTGPASHSSGHSPVSMPRDSMGATLPPLLGERDGLARGYEHAPPRMLQGHPGHASHYAHSHPHPGQPGAMSPPLVNGHLPSPRDRYSAPPPHGQHGQHHHPHGQHPQHQHPQHQYPHPHHQPHQGPHPHSQPLPAQPPLPPHLQPRHDGAASTSASLRNLMH